MECVFEMCGKICQLICFQSSRKRHWLVTDVVGSPVQDENGPMDSSMIASLRNTTIEVSNEQVNAFRLQSAIEQCKPDCVAAFGTWRNVLNDGCVNENVLAKPTAEQRSSIQGRQCKIFNIPEDFVVSVSTAVLAQSDASLLFVGPSHYLWRNFVRSGRPQLQFWIGAEENVDYYQGCQRMNSFVANYWPGSGKVMPVLDCQTGRGSIVDVLAKHQRILIISAGRGEFWAKIITMVDKRGPSIGAPMVPRWGQAHQAWLKRMGWAWSFNTPCEREACSGANVCMRCLRNIKRWSCIDDLKFSALSKDAEAQCVYEDFNDAIESFSSSDTQ